MRKETTITITDRGRELTFLIKEMSAVELQRWLLRLAGVLLGNGNVTQLIGDLSRKGINILSGVDFEKAEPLLFDLLSCCYLKTGKTPIQVKPETVDGMLEDVRSLATLEAEAAKLNFYFFDLENLLGLTDSNQPLQAVKDTIKQSISMR